VCVCVCVCVSVREDISVTTRTIFTNFCACCLWPWLGPPPASLGYVTYFRFCGRHHVFSITGRIAVWISLQRTNFA